MTKRKDFLIMLVATALLAVGCNGDEKKQDKGNSTTAGSETVEVDSAKFVRRQMSCERGFYQITHIGTFDVFFTEGDYSLEFEGDSTLFPSVVAEFDSGTLTLSRRGENNTDVHVFNSSSALKVYVSCPELRLLAACNSGSFRGYGTIHTSDMQVGVMGAGSVVLDSVECRSLMVQNNDAGTVSFASCHAKSIDLMGKSSGSIKGAFDVEGLAKVTFTGAATNDLSCKADKVELLSTGSATTNLTVDCAQLDVQAVGAGTLNLDGKATVKNYLTNPLSENARNVTINDNVKKK